MGLVRTLILKGSQNEWLRKHAQSFPFVRRAVSRFMPGEHLDDAVAAARNLASRGIMAMLTKVGENVTDAGQATAVTDHYLEVVRRIRETGIPAEVSVKLTHLGLDLGVDLCLENLLRIVEQSAGSVVWIDMESSEYVDRTLHIFRRAKAVHQNVGVCLQAYLYRTEADLTSLLPLDPAIRLVKGAYNESASVAFPRKQDVDRNFFELARRMIGPEGRRAGLRAQIATHDVTLTRRIEQFVSANGADRGNFEFSFLYGVQRSEQIRLARAGYRTVVLITYGTYWFPWYMRRLAERPANVWFVLRSLVGG